MKRVIAVSDSHGDAAGLHAAFEQAFRQGRIDAAVFLGDGLADFESIRPELMMKGVQCHAVRGNNDWRGQDPSEALLVINGARIYACHGHMWYVKYGLDRLWYAAREHEAHVVLYGHTHREKIDLEYGVQLINPGAVCERSQARSAYAELLIDDNGFVQPGLCKWE